MKSGVNVKKNISLKWTTKILSLKIAYDGIIPMNKKQKRRGWVEDDLFFMQQMKSQKIAILIIILC